MKFTNEIRDFILGYLAGDGPTPNGQACRFMEYNGIGIKFYGASECKAEYAFEAQTRAAEVDIGPQTGDFFTINLRLAPSNSIKLYGYLTEIATDVGEDPLHDTAVELAEKMEENGFSTYDFGVNNCGWVGGKYVCIDFDPLSMGV